MINTDSTHENQLSYLFKSKSHCNIRDFIFCMQNSG